MQFQYLVRNILFIQYENDPLRPGLVTPTAYQNKVINITKPNNYYHSRIQAGAEAQGSYLVFAAKFEAEQMAEITMIDIARAGIVFSEDAIWEEVKNKVVAWVQSHPKNNLNAKRLWVKSVVLSSVVYQNYTKIESNASGQVGEVIGVKTGVYRKSEKNNKSVILGFEAFDIDKLASQSMNKALILSNKGLFEQTRYMGVIEGNIK